MAHAQKPDFVFRRNGRVHFKSAGASVQSTTGSRGVRISRSNAGYTMLWGSVKSTGYPLHSPVSPSLPLPASSCAITFQLDFTSIPALTYKTISYTLALGLLFSTLRSSGAAMEDAVSQNQHATTYNVITAISGHQQSASLAYTPITTS